jgi:hypothetical protein
MNRLIFLLYIDYLINGVVVLKENFFWNNGFACGEPWKRLRPKRSPQASKPQTKLNR